MHITRKDKYSNRIAEVVDEATYIDSTNRIERPRNDRSRSYKLLDDTDHKRRSIIRDLLQKEKWSSKFSEEYVKRKIDRIISSAVGKPDNTSIQLAFSKLCSEFDSFNSVYSVVIPLSGISLKAQKIKLGPIELIHMNTHEIDKLTSKVQKILSESTLSENIKPFELKQFKNTVTQFNDEVCAHYSIIAEPERARERAHEDLCIALDLLRYVAAATHPYFGVRIGLKGEFSRAIRFELAHSDDALNFESTPLGPKANFEINEETLNIMEKLGIFELSKFISIESDFSNFIETILDSIHWYAHATNLEEETDRVLNFITSIECFFETKDKAISATISEGMALIFGDTFEERMKIRTLMKRLYDLRSRISHGGRMVVVNSDIRQLQYFSAILIEFAYKNRTSFQDKSSFGKWIDSLRLGFSNDPTKWVDDKTR